MPTAQVRPGEELWHTTTAGTVWVTITDDRGREKQLSAGGRKGAPLRIKTVDREINQEAIYEVEADPFRNGLLKRVDADQNEDESTASDQALDDTQLVKFFSKNGTNFQKAIAGLNEINVRRLRAMADDVDITTAQLAHLEEVIEQKYRKHGDSRTYRELMGLGEVTN